MANLVAAMPVPGVGYWIATFVVAIAVVVAHLRNMRNRNAVADALKKASGGRPELKSWSLCTKGELDLTHYTLLPPERLLCYDQPYIAVFLDMASKQTTIFGDTALQRYLTPTLIWNDVVFAPLLGLLTSLVALAVPSFCPHPWVACIALFFAAMAMVYAAVDIAEDFRLTRLLRADAVPDAQAVRLTLVLTRIKMMSLAASVIGGIIFALLLLMPVRPSQHETDAPKA